MGLGNLSLSDMPWLGKPADPAQSFAQGMAQGQSFASRQQDYAAKEQAMEQSADMHPLKMADMASNTAYRDAITDFNVSSKDARVESINLINRARNLENNYNDQTMEDRVSLVGLKVRQGEDDLEHFRKLRPLQREAQSLSNTARGYDISRAAIHLTDQAQRTALNAKSIETYQGEQGAVNEQLSLLQNLPVERLANYVPPASITHPRQRKKITDYVAELRGTKQAADLENERLQDQLDYNSERANDRAIEKGLGREYSGILDIRDPFSQLPYYREENGRLTQPGVKLRERLVQSKDVWEKLTTEDQDALLRDKLGSSGAPAPGVTRRGRYYDDFSGQIILNREGLTEAQRLIKARGVAVREAEVKWNAKYGLQPFETKDGKTTYRFLGETEKERIDFVREKAKELEEGGMPQDAAWRNAIASASVSGMKVISSRDSEADVRRMNLSQGQHVMRIGRDGWSFGTIQDGRFVAAGEQGNAGPQGNTGQTVDPAKSTGNVEHGNEGELNPFTGRINPKRLADHEILTHAQSIHKALWAQGASLELRQQLIRIGIDNNNPIGWNSDDSPDDLANDIMELSTDSMWEYGVSIRHLFKEHSALRKPSESSRGNLSEYNLNQVASQLREVDPALWPKRVQFKADVGDEGSGGYADVPDSIGDRKKLQKSLERYVQWGQLRNRMGEELTGHKGVQSQWKKAKGKFHNESNR